MFAWLALLAFLAAISSGRACETLTFIIPKNDKCYSHAVFLNPVSFAQYPNGTCVLQSVCVGKESETRNTAITTTSIESCVKIDKKQGTFSMITKKIVKSAKTRAFKWKCPCYEKISTRDKVLLLRTHASSEVSPYWVFRKGNVSTQHMTLSEANASGTVNYKSPLMAQDRHASLREISVEMYEQNGARMTSVRFRINAMESIQKGRWFAKDRLIAAMPWSIVHMRGTRYNFFSIDGVKRSTFIRRFLINANFGGCHKDRGFMAIIERATCNWEMRKKHFPSYLWTNDGTSSGKYITRTNEASEFRIYGIFDKSPHYYVRKSENC